MLNFEVLSKLKLQLPSYLTKRQPYILEITNESRRFVLLAKSQFDMTEWYKAIKFQIEQLADNQLLADNQSKVYKAEQVMANRDL
jgi:hypothetical protein